MKLPLRSVANCLGQEPLAGRPEKEVASDLVATGWSIDSRTVRPGDVFFALRGPNHNGHHYVLEVLGKGAIAAVVDVDMDVPPEAGEIFRVPDALQALQK